MEVSWSALKPKWTFLVTSTQQTRSSEKCRRQSAGAEGFPQKQEPFWGECIRESGSYAVIWSTAAVECVRKEKLLLTAPLSMIPTPLHCTVAIPLCHLHPENTLITQWRAGLETLLTHTLCVCFLTLFLGRQTNVHTMLYI